MNAVMDEMVRVVRKHGVLKVNGKDTASSLVSYAKKNYGYTFKSRTQGWNQIVTDEDV